MRFTAGLFAALVVLSLPASARDFYFGADLSFANEMDDCGAVFRDHGKLTEGVVPETVGATEPTFDFDVRKPVD
jgi:hypothetical protein